MPDENIRRDEALLCGRLVALPSSTTLEQLKVMGDNAGFRNVISIDFPAMPESIELVRSAEYLVSSNIVMPDGIHQYKGTKPMDIPVSFRLHSMDQQYCKKGALTLLQLAARLHSFILPVSTFKRGTIVAPRAKDMNPKENGGKPDDGTLNEAATKEDVYEVQSGGQPGGIFNPVTCWLHLMWVGNDQPGISCIGYVREVKVKFNGPWLRGPGNSFNLPTSADFDFTFVHRPGHGNNTSYTDSAFPPTVADSGQAYADDVKDKFYNTRDLVHAANYQGFGRNQSNLTG